MSSGNNVPYSLEYMKMGPRDSYLCLIPKPLDLSPPQSDDDPDEEIAPARSWSLLQPLAGTCLYVRIFFPAPIRFSHSLIGSQQHRQGWFTYSYCHNSQIRQFKELPSQSHIPGNSRANLFLLDHVRSPTSSILVLAFTPITLVCSISEMLPTDVDVFHLMF